MGKSMTIYMTTEQYHHMLELQKYYSQNAPEVTPSQLVRYATENLYRNMDAEKKKEEE